MVGHTQPTLEHVTETGRLLEWHQTTTRANRVRHPSRDPKTKVLKLLPEDDRSPCDLCPAGQHIDDEKRKLVADERGLLQQTRMTNVRHQCPPKNVQASYVSLQIKFNWDTRPPILALKVIGQGQMSPKPYHYYGSS